tara:strand:+ start:979 stop:1512 length:534 start_codon:yes stop_codon:yes gene_type:complete
MSTLTVDNIVGATTAANVKLPAGTILQTQTFQGYNGDGAHTNFSISSQTYGATDCAVSITPKYSSSKILVTMHGQGFYQDAVVTNAVKMALYRSVGGASFAAVPGLPSGQVSRHIAYFNHSTASSLQQASFQHLDSPATTSAVIYKIYLARLQGSGYGRFLANGDDSFSITAQEISQ